MAFSFGHLYCISRVSKMLFLMNIAVPLEAELLLKKERYGPVLESLGNRSIDNLDL